MRTVTRKLCLILAIALCLCTLSLASCDAGGKPAQTGTEQPTGAPTDPTTEAPAETPTEASTEPVIEAPTEIPTEAPTAPVTEAPTEAPTEARTEAQTIDIEAYMKMDEVTDLTLPESSSTLSRELANQLLSLCADYDFEHAGFEVLARVHYDKDPMSPAHTCAFMIGKKSMTYKGQTRTVVLTAVRGTSGGEWFSNFDVYPSRNTGLGYAENFMLTAEDVYATLKPILDAETDPVVVICGHSRGAACANLLGTLANADFGVDNVFTYTFATPSTVRTGTDSTCPNIFNFINPVDVVPLLPLPAWGFGRYGTDILLPASPEDTAALTAAMQVLAGIAPTVESYYNDRHALTGPGLAEDGMTVFEVMTEFGKLLADGGSLGAATGASPLAALDMRLMFMAQDSDLHPLLEAVTGLFANNNEGMTRVLIRHIPSTYQGLMKLERQLNPN